MFFTDHGHIVLPSGEEAKHIIKGHPKPVPLPTFLAGLVHTGVDYIRLVIFGMKQRVEDLPPFPPELLQNNTVQNGYPVNRYDVSVTRRLPYLYLMKPVPPIPRNITVDQFPIISPIFPHPARFGKGAFVIYLRGGRGVAAMAIFRGVCFLSLQFRGLSKIT